MTEEKKTGEEDRQKVETKRKRHPVWLDAFLILSLLFVVLSAASYWYVRQPEARRKSICDDTGQWLDQAARPLGELVDRAVKQLRWKPNEPQQEKE